MSAAYPWVRDSQNVSGSPIGYLQVTSDYGLYIDQALKIQIGTGATSNQTLIVNGSIQFNSPSGSGITFQTSQGGSYNTIYSTSEDIYIVSQGNSTSHSGVGAIYLYAANGLYLNGNPIGGGVSSVNVYTGSNPTYGSFTSDGLYINPTSGSVEVGFKLVNGTNTTVNNPAPGVWYIDATGGGGGGVSSVGVYNGYNGSYTFTSNGLYMYPSDPAYSNPQIGFLLISGNGTTVNNPSPGVWQVDATGGGGGGVTTVTSSSLYVPNSSGSVTVDITLQGSGSTTCTYQGNGVWDINSSGGGGGGDVYWNQLVNTYTTYYYLGNNYSFGNQYNPQYCLGLNNNTGTSGGGNVVHMQNNSDQQNILTPNNPYDVPYIRVGYYDYTDVYNTSYPYTLLAAVDNTSGTYPQRTTLATVGMDMHLYSKKRLATTSPESGVGDIYLYADNIYPGNFVNLGYSNTKLGSSTYYWSEVNSLLFNQTSDIKVKDNIEKLDIEYAKNLILKINPVSYTLKQDTSENKRKHFGVIAQEIKEIIGNENLGIHTDGETQAVSYTEFIAPLIKTVQDLLKRVSDLENEIAELKK